MPTRPTPAARPRPNETAAFFRPPPDFEVSTGLPVLVGDRGGRKILTLQHDYRPDEFAPAVGWKVETKDGLYVIASVDGRNLTCDAGGAS